MKQKLEAYRAAKVALLISVRKAIASLSTDKELCAAVAVVHGNNCNPREVESALNAQRAHLRFDTDTDERGEIDGVSGALSVHSRRRGGRFYRFKIPLSALVEPEGLKPWRDDVVARAETERVNIADHLRAELKTVQNKIRRLPKHLRIAPKA